MKSFIVFRRTLSQDAQALFRTTSRAKTRYSLQTALNKLSNDTISLAFRTILAYASPGDAAIIFVAGMDHIVAAFDIYNELPPELSSKIEFRPVHSDIDQRPDIKRFDPGLITVYVTTNVLESGVTIPNLLMVVDLGLRKHQEYDSEKDISVLKLDLISEAAATQRSGRAGRVRPGLALRYALAEVINDRYHQCCSPSLSRMYPASAIDIMQPYDSPELLTSPLETVVLRVKSLEYVAGEET